MEFGHLQLRLLHLNHIDFIVIFAHFLQHVFKQDCPFLILPLGAPNSIAKSYT